MRGSEPTDKSGPATALFDDRDEYSHPAGDDPQYSESMYFNAVDPSSGYSMLIRIGNRINEGHSEITVLAYLPGGGAVFHFARVPIADEPAFAGGGLRVEVVVPTKQLRVHFAGTGHRLGHGTDLANPKAALTGAALVPFEVVLDYDSVAPLFGLGTGEAGTSGMGGAEDVVAAAHYEVPCRVSGHLQIGVDRVQFAGLGIRDHSWGPRRWQGPTYWRWLSGLFDEQTAFVAWAVRVGDEREPGSGMVMSGGRAVPVVRVDIRSEYGPDPHYPRALHLTMTTADGSVTEVTGEVLATVPLRNRRDGVTARLAEVVVRYRMGERTGYGIAEYHDLMIDGLPAGRLEA